MSKCMGTLSVSGMREVRDDMSECVRALSGSTSQMCGDTREDTGMTWACECEHGDTCGVR